MSVCCNVETTVWTFGKRRKAVVPDAQGQLSLHIRGHMHR